MGKVALQVISFLACGYIAFAADGASLPKMELKPLWPNVAIQRPVWFCEAPDGSGRKFVLEQRGRVLILPEEQSATNVTVFLDISDRKPYASNEEGLLGLAFHPQFKTNRKFYVYYSLQKPQRHTLVSEFTVAKGDSRKADIASERILFEQPQPYPNHKGGCAIFGPDGFLYISLGDGGSANDPHENGQNLKTLLGKIIRIDVNSRASDLQYGIPSDNPFADKGDGLRGEIWAYGLRNVWRFSFDRATGALWAADVGQNKFEEVDVIERGGNYGWNWREGFHPFKTSGTPPAGAKFIPPVIEYPHLAIYDTNTAHSPGLSITGGYVYRGKKLPALQGAYVYADFAAGTIWALRHENGKVTESAALYSTPKATMAKNVSSFGEDSDGKLYVLAFEGTVNGKIYELVEAK
ncbi:MAG TPA: PQQ-dependent sugar dehydrogenase [Candidatus Limnocylindria bacterium]|nr:PQQ-dependent sugar dehydrogenase [Candidatus Limnocylindria bacterium]